MVHIYLPGEGLTLGAGFLFLVILVIGAERLVEATIRLSRKLGLSELFIGLTVISIGTSVPEIVTHIIGSINILTGSIPQEVVSATVLGTNIGSDIIQQTLIIGVVSLLAVIPITKHIYSRDIPFLLYAAVLLFLLSVNGDISRIDGIILVLFYTLYLYLLWKQENRKRHNKARRKIHWMGALKDTISVTFWLAAVLLAAEEVLHISTHVIENFGISGSLIGVIAIGVATALPEFTTALTAAVKKRTGISIGTLIGSNITNPAFAVGIGAIIAPYKVPQSLVLYDLPVKIILTILLIIMISTNRRISRREGIILIGLYLIYLIARVFLFPTDTFL